MDPKMFEAIEAHMHSCMKDSAHDKEHVYRVLWAAIDIASYETNVDRDVLTASCLLHDIGREDQFRDPTLCHAEAGSGKAYSFLLGLGWAEGDAAHVRDCVLTHRFRTDRRPATLEAKILFDADKLDVTGAVGVARTLFFGGQISQPLYFLDEAGNVITGADSPPSFFREYNYKLRGIGDTLHTNRARELARGRRETSDAFYNALLYELTACSDRGREALAAWKAMPST